MGIILSIFIFLLLFSTVVLTPIYYKYKKSRYKNSSGHSFFKTILDKGNYGEFLTYVQLENLKGNKKLMVNLYLPKVNGGTTEIDLLMICETGIYVFESKNYGGWIFGNEKQKYWTQTFKTGKKNKFYNPIWQNNGHITALKNTLKFKEDKIYHSYIIFSDRCELKKIEMSTKNIIVLKRNKLLKSI